ncbi:hypothetical protein IWX90DRAFT_28144 [Phyllosticta citrichinensis]|uniref:Uncharacterized protein n=1 Tax=Phyllosticta citrichinensis TaxID=1130410 RepID=A0ABR1Y748_9PEZI
MIAHISRRQQKPKALTATPPSRRARARHQGRRNPSAHHRLLGLICGGGVQRRTHPAFTTREPTSHRLALTRYEAMAVAFFELRVGFLLLTAACNPSIASEPYGVPRSPAQRDQDRRGTGRLAALEKSADDARDAGTWSGHVKAASRGARQSDPAVGLAQAPRLVVVVVVVVVDLVRFVISQQPSPIRRAVPLSPFNHFTPPCPALILIPHGHGSAPRRLSPPSSCLSELLGRAASCGS